MKTILFSSARLLAAAALLGVLAACGGNDDPAPAPTPAVVAPTIVAPPAAAAVTEGQSASFNVVAAGTAPLAYQWRRNGSAIAGATAATYTLAAATLADNGASFTVVVSNSAGSVTSGAAALTVNAQTTLPTITAQPGALAVITGGNASFSATVSGTPEPTLRWFIAGGADLADGTGSGALAGATIAGATTAMLSLTGVPQSANGLQLRLRATNSAGTVESNVAALTVNVAGLSISAAAGGTVASADGKVRLVIPANALTADTVVTFTAVPAPALPSGGAPFAEDFASFEPVGDAFYRIDFAGGQIKADADVIVDLRRATSMMALASASQVRRSSTPPDDQPIASVVECGPGRTIVRITRVEENGGYDRSQGILCDGDGSSRVTVGPARVIQPPSAVLGTRALARAGDDRLLRVISFNNGRSAFGFEGVTSTSGGGSALVSGLAIVAANGSVSNVVLPQSATLVGFDGNGRVLAQTAGCRLAVFGQRVSSLLGAFLPSTPEWTVQLPLQGQTNSCSAIFAAAPTAGGGWVVATGGNLDRYSSTGAVTPLLQAAALPPSDIRRQITYRRLAVDAAGNLWGLGTVAQNSGGLTCGFGFSVSGPCPVVIKLDASGALLGFSQLGNAIVQRANEVAPMALALDAAGNAYVAFKQVEQVTGSSTVGSGRIVVRRIAASNVGVSWLSRLSNTQSQDLGEIAVNPTTGEVFAGSAADGVVHRVGPDGVETGVTTVGAPFAGSVASGLSINPSGTLTFIGDLIGSFGGVTSSGCLTTAVAQCTDILVRRFEF